jgi:hypothetical protein
VNAPIDFNPEVYHAYKGGGRDALPIKDAPDNLSDDVVAFLNRVYLIKASTTLTRSHFRADSSGYWQRHVKAAYGSTLR